MADEEDYDGEEEAEEETVIEKPGVDYDELNPDNGFKKVEWEIWTAYEKAVLSKAEDEREDEEEWSETYATDNTIDRNQITAVVKLGIYAGGRDEFNQRTGEGKAIYANSDEYEGQYWEGKKNGKGKYIYKSLGMSEVDKLLMQLKEVKKDEEPFIDFIPRAASALAIGSEIVRASLEYGFFPCYNGDYINNLRHGRGVIKNKDASVYKGDWKDNKRHGEGVYFFLNGDTYCGQWLEGQKHGSGCYTYANGKGSYTGEWDLGVFKEGQWVMTDKNYYEGKYDAKNRPCDPLGCIKFPQLGMVQQGEFVKGRWCPTDELIRLDDYSSAKPPEPEEPQIEQTA